MWQLLRTFPLMLAILAVPILPFVLFGDVIEQSLKESLDQDADTSTVSVVIVVLLSTDVFLPVPSSVLSTISGWRLGWFAGTLVTWLGMTIGAAAGYHLAWRLGPKFSSWFCRSDDLNQMKDLMNHYGPSVLILGRALPVFAEASVLMAGIHRLSWKRFFLPVVVSNFIIAMVYSSLGDLAAKYQWLAAAVGVSIGLPLLMAAITKNLLGKGDETSSK